MYDLPLFGRYFHRLERAPFARGRVGSLPSKFSTVAAHNRRKVMHDALRSKYAEFELVACYVQEGWVRQENLLEDGVVEGLDARARHADKREGDREDFDDVAGHVTLLSAVVAVHDGELGTPVKEEGKPGARGKSRGKCRRLILVRQ